jgi:hypothetical protein
VTGNPQYGPNLECGWRVLPGPCPALEVTFEWLDTEEACGPGAGSSRDTGRAVRREGEAGGGSADPGPGPHGLGACPAHVHRSIPRCTDPQGGRERVKPKALPATNPKKYKNLPSPTLSQGTSAAGALRPTKAEGGKTFRVFSTDESIFSRGKPPRPFLVSVHTILCKCFRKPRMHLRIVFNDKTPEILVATLFRVHAAFCSIGTSTFSGGHRRGSAPEAS